MFPSTKEFSVYKDAREKSKIPKPPLRTPSKTPAKPTEDFLKDRKPLSVVHRASSNSNHKSTTPSSAGKPQQRSSPAGNGASPVTDPPSLCSECTRAASHGAVCFIGNDGRVSACSSRSAVRLCKNLNCAASNPDYVKQMANTPKKYLISKRHQLKAQYAPKQKLVQPKSPRLGNNTMNMDSVDGLLTPVKSMSPSKSFNRNSSSKNECRLSTSSNDEIPTLCVALSPNAKTLDYFHDDILSHSSPFHDAIQSPCDEMLTFSDCDYSFLGMYQDAELKTLDLFTTPNNSNLRRDVDVNSLNVESQPSGNGDDEVFSTPIQDLPRENVNCTQYDYHIGSVENHSPETESQPGSGDFLFEASQSNDWRIENDSQNQMNEVISAGVKPIDQQFTTEEYSTAHNGSQAIKSDLDSVVVESVVEETTTSLIDSIDSTASSEAEIVTSGMGLMKDDEKNADKLTTDEETQVTMEVDASIMVDPVHNFECCVEEHVNFTSDTFKHQVFGSNSANDVELESSQAVSNGTVNDPLKSEAAFGGTLEHEFNFEEAEGNSVHAVNEIQESEFDVDETEELADSAATDRTLEPEVGIEETEDSALNAVNRILETEFDVDELEDQAENCELDYIENSNPDVCDTPVFAEDLKNGTKDQPNKRANHSRQRRVLQVIEQQSPETVRLRKQQTLERKQAEEWMLNHAIEEVVQKLNPTGETKVKVLVEAFERILSSPDITESSS